jgi:hypothetical protein
MNQYRPELVICLVLGILPACATATEADLASGQGADETAGSMGSGTSGSDSVGGGGTPSTPDGTSGASAGGIPASGGDDDRSDAGAGNAPSGKAGSSAAGAPAGGAAHGGSSGVAGSPSTGGSGGGTSPALGPWTFDAGMQGWVVHDHSATITTMPTVAAGVVTFTGMPFTGASQFTDFALTLSPTADLTGRTLHAKLRRVSGGFVGVQVYAYGGAWVGSPFASLTSATFIDIALPIVASSGFTPEKITRVGIKFNTGSGTGNKFADTTVEIDSVSIE